MKLLKAAALFLIPFTHSHPTKQHNDDLLIHTNLFSVRGIPWPNTTSVRFFGNIPYAEPPIGTARFRPPITKRPTNTTIDASWFGPSCIQYSNGQKTVYSEYLRGFLLSPGQQQSEDCLTLNIWSPRGGEGLPVMIWIHGGGFTSGGSASPYKYGNWLAREQNVVVVAIK
jgi:carboxylesterase type B